MNIQRNWVQVSIVLKKKTQQNNRSWQLQATTIKKKNSLDDAIHSIIFELLMYGGCPSSWVQGGKHSLLTEIWNSQSNVTISKKVMVGQVYSWGRWVFYKKVYHLKQSEFTKKLKKKMTASTRAKQITW